jgi:2-polyprenyl-6-methoxyphenol hydroxylase-like FAD-dependent oxidoreductase
MAMNEAPQVLVVGAGPVGLTLAAFLARHGVRCRIIDKLPEPVPYCRAIGVTPRTLEVWDDLGIARDMIDAGIWLAGMRSIIHGRPPRDESQDLSDLPYGQLGVPQNATERVLARHLARCGVAVERGAAFAGLTQEDGEVAADLEHAGGRRERARFRYVVGCDGAHSAVRHALAIPFEGEAYPMMFMLGDVRIGWDLPRGMALRALRLVEDGPPAMFIAIPLPEPGRYRVSMLAPPTAAPRHGDEHGIQAELQGPQLAEIQAVADDLLPAGALVSDLRWSSLFRISMRLASRYRGGRVFIAGDAAHIHPPTGGQGMNTGIQDAYNLSWKLALVLQGAAPEELLDSYEAERRPVGAEVVARTRAASEAYGREQPERSDRLVDTQIRISYRGSPWVGEDGAGLPGSAPAAGDRAPDAGGLRRRGVGFPMRLFDILRGPEHVLVVYCRDRPRFDGLLGLVQPPRPAERLRVVAVVAPGIAADEPPGAALYHDAEGAFAAAYGGEEASFLVRPDGHIGWRGRSSSEPGLSAYLDRTLASVRTTGI